MLRLKKVLDSKGLPYEQYAALLGISKKSLYNKTIGETEFTYGEFMKLKTIFPEYNIDYLLAEEPGV